MNRKALFRVASLVVGLALGQVAEAASLSSPLLTAGRMAQAGIRCWITNVGTNRIQINRMEIKDDGGASQPLVHTCSSLSNPAIEPGATCQVAHFVAQEGFPIGYRAEIQVQGSKKDLRARCVVPKVEADGGLTDEILEAAEMR